MELKINFKVIFLLGLSGAAFAATIHFVHAAQVRRSAQALLDEAKRLEEAGEVDLAADCFAQYLALAPGDADAKARFGLLLNRAAKTPREWYQAYEALWEALRADSARDDVRWELAQLAIRFGRHDEVQEHLAVLLSQEAENAQYLLLRARLAVKEKEDNEAASWYAKAAQAAPKDVEICAEYANLVRERLDSPFLAEQVIDQMLRATGRTSEARVAAAIYFRRFDTLEKAEAALAPKPNERRSQVANEWILAAQLAQDRNKRESAQELLLQGWRQFPDDSRFPIELAYLEFLMRIGGAKAQEYLKSALAKLPDQPGQLLAVGLLLVDLGRKDEAAQVLNRLDNKKGGPEHDQLRAGILMKQGAWAEAAALLEKTRKDVRSVGDSVRQTTLMLADCYGHLLNADQQLVVLRQATNLDPTWLVGRRRLVQVLADTDKIDQAIVTLSLFATLAPEDKATLARLYLVREERLPEENRNWSDIERILEELGHSSWDPSAVMSIRAQVLAAQGKLDEARRQAESLRDRDRNQVAPWLLLIALAEKQQMGMPATAVLAEAEHQLGPRVELSMARAHLWLKAPVATRQNLPSPLLEVERFKGNDRNRMLTALGEMFSAAGEPATARRLWAELAESEPDNFKAWCAQLDDALEKKQWDHARRVLGQVRRLEGAEGPQTLYGEAAIRVGQAGPADEQSLIEAREYLARVAALRPTWANVYLLDALICEREGNSGLALEKYKAALDRGETRLPIVRRVLELMYAQRLFGEAVELLRKLPEQQQTSPELVELATRVTQENAGREGEDPETGRQTAVEQARKAVATNSTNARNVAWLGQMAALAGQPKEAEEALRRACELNSKSPETWVTLVIFLARTDAKKAEAVIEDAKKRLPAEQLPLSLALFHEAMGRIQQAAEQYQTALMASPKDTILLRHAATFYLRYSQPAKAVPHLRKFVEIASAGADPSATAWGRRHLALALAFQGGNQRFNEAEALLKQNQQDAKNGLEDRRIEALVRATRPAQQREAIKLFESLGALTNAERYSLAQLYETNGNWPAAEGQFRALLRSDDKNVDLLARYIRGLLNQKQTSNAATWLRKLVALAPDSLETLNLQVFLLKQSGRNDEAAKLVLRYAQVNDARLDLAGQWLETLDLPAEAERMFRDFADSSKQAERSLPLALFLGRQKRVAEGLAICEKAWKSCDPVAVAIACVAIVRAGGAQRQRQVETWILAAAAKHPDRIELRCLLTELQELNGLYDEAILVYRQILLKDRSNSFALNNLAFLLALKGTDLAEAQTLVQRAITLTGPTKNQLNTRATVYLRQGRLELALQDLEASLDISGKPSPDIYVRLARIQLGANDRTAAQASHRKALDAGFRIEMLHPLEREEYGKMAKALE